MVDSGSTYYFFGRAFQWFTIVYNCLLTLSTPFGGGGGGMMRVPYKHDKRYTKLVQSIMHEYACMNN